MLSQKKTEQKRVTNLLTSHWYRNFSKYSTSRRALHDYHDTVALNHLFHSYWSIHLNYVNIFCKSCHSKWKTTIWDISLMDFSENEGSEDTKVCTRTFYWMYYFIWRCNTLIYFDNYKYIQHGQWHLHQY